MSWGRITKLLPCSIPHWSGEERSAPATKTLSATVGDYQKSLIGSNSCSRDPFQIAISLASSVMVTYMMAQHDHKQLTPPRSLAYFFFPLSKLRSPAIATVFRTALQPDLLTCTLAIGFPKLSSSHGLEEKQFVLGHILGERGS